MNILLSWKQESALIISH